jgi:hypothetical protein
MARRPTGRTKDDILVLMYSASFRNQRLSVGDLALQLGVKPNTVSGHLRDMAEYASPLTSETSLRGVWSLTAVGRARACELLPGSGRLPLTGLIAAGPALALNDANLDDYLPVIDLDPEAHFALRVRGVSMTSYHICDGDIVILRRVGTFDPIPDGAIVAALVPEGTDVDLPDWHERLRMAIRMPEGANPPALDHVTLKEMDERLRRLRGSQGTVEPPALQVIGVLVRVWRDYKDGRSPQRL